MTGLIAPLVIATVSLIVLGVFLHKRRQRGRAFDQVLRDRDFARQVDGSGADIDFTITLQWPDAPEAFYDLWQRYTEEEWPEHTRQMVNVLPRPFMRVIPVEKSLNPKGSSP